MSHFNEEVFHIYGTYTYEEAQIIANMLKCYLASWSQMMRAYENGANWCSYGWSKDQQAYYPIQQNYYDTLKKKGKEENCGAPGLNGGFFRDTDLEFGINCYGVKPNFDLDLRNQGINFVLSQASIQNIGGNNNDNGNDNGIPKCKPDVDKSSNVNDDYNGSILGSEYNSIGSSNANANMDSSLSMSWDNSYIGSSSNDKVSMYDMASMSYSNSMSAAASAENTSGLYGSIGSASNSVPGSGSVGTTSTSASGSDSVGSASTSTSVSNSVPGSGSVGTTSTSASGSGSVGSTSTTTSVSNSVPGSGSVGTTSTSASGSGSVGSTTTTTSVANSVPGSGSIGNPLYCEDPVACNYKELGSCEYHGSKKDCNGSSITCEDDGACNTGSLGECMFPEENYNCAGSWTGPYCDANNNPSACNKGSRADCVFPEQSYNCDGNWTGIYCDPDDNPTACNAGSRADCVFPDENYNCAGSWTGPYCDPDDNPTACNTGSRKDCDYPEENYNCAGSWTGPYCDDSDACNTGSRKDCVFPDENYNCAGSWTGPYCDDSDACNTGSRKDCDYPEENYNCAGSWTGPYCDDSGACNTGSRKDCEYPDNDRIGCDGNPLYCTDPNACNYDGSNGSCIYHGSRHDCQDRPLYCTDPAACNYTDLGECEYHKTNKDCDGNTMKCKDKTACNYNELGECISPNTGYDCNGALLDPELNLDTDWPIFMLNKDDSGDYTLQHQDGSDVTYDELDLKSQARSLYQKGYYGVLMDNSKYTIAYVDDDLQTEIVKYNLSKSEYEKEINTLENVTEMNQSDWDIMTSGEMELILYIIIPNNFKGVFRIHDGMSVNNNLSDDFVCTGNGSKLSVGTTTITYDIVKVDADGNSLPDYYTLYKVQLFEHFSTYTLSVKSSENFTNKQGNTPKQYGKYWLEHFANNNNNSNSEVTKLLQINIPCQDPVACNFNTGSVCQYPFDLYGNSQYNCDGSWTGDYCDSNDNPDACNPGSKADCVFANDLYNNERDCDGVCIDENAKNYGETENCEYDELYTIFGDSVEKNSDNDSYTLVKDFTLKESIEFTEIFTLYLATGVTFDGGYDIDTDEGPSIAYTGSDEWPGLFQLTAGSNESKHISSVKNIKFVLNGKTLKYGCGCIIGSGKIDSLTKHYKMNISDCLSTTTNDIKMINSQCGGITGKDFSSAGCECNIDNCINEIIISGSATQSGGIVGAWSGRRSLTITNCVNTGNIQSAMSGGIIGAFAGSSAHKSLQISYCVNDTDQIGGNGAGGICGAYCGYNSGNVRISYCSSEGKLKWASGGLVGALAAINCTDNTNNRSIIVSHSYYQSNKDPGTGCGGLFGKYTCGMSLSDTDKNNFSFDDLDLDDVDITDTDSFTGEVNIYQCYSLFNSTNKNTGGIIMNGSASHGIINIYNTYFMGTIENNSGNQGNAIIGGIINGFGENVTIGNCYSVGPLKRLGPNIDGINISLSYSSDEWDDNYAYATIAQELPDNNYALSWYVPGNNSRWYIAGDGEGNMVQGISGSLNFNNTNATSLNNGLIKDSMIEIFGTSIEESTDDSGNTTRELIEDFTLNGDIVLDENVYITIASGVTFDGNDNTISYTGSDDWEGLFQNKNGEADNLYTFTVKNINFDLGSANIAEGCGCIIGTGRIDSDNAYNYMDITVENCVSKSSSSSPGAIQKYAGGIVGRTFGRTGVGVIKDCVNYLEVSGESAGGICGNYGGYNDASLTIEDCKNDGDVSGKHAGGICGEDTGGYGSDLNLINCENTGEISGLKAGGIGGYEVGKSGKLVTVNGCSNTGDISGKYAGGIFGSSFAKSGIAIVRYCSNDGDMTGNGYSGGICGGYAGNSGSVVIEYCYNMGGLYGSYSGGICGSSSGNSGVLIVFNCFNYADSANTYTGGICGGYAGNGSGSVYLYNNYSISEFDMDECGAFIGSNGYSGVYITNCYHVGESLDDTTNFYGINSSSDIDDNISNCKYSDEWNVTDAYYSIFSTDSLGDDFNVYWNAVDSQHSPWVIGTTDDYMDSTTKFNLDLSKIDPIDLTLLNTNNNNNTVSIEIPLSLDLFSSTLSKEDIDNIKSTIDTIDNS